MKTIKCPDVCLAHQNSLHACVCLAKKGRDPEEVGMPPYHKGCLCYVVDQKDLTTEERITEINERTKDTIEHERLAKIKLKDDICDSIKNVNMLFSTRNIIARTIIQYLEEKSWHWIHFINTTPNDFIHLLHHSLEKKAAIEKENFKSSLDKQTIVIECPQCNGTGNVEPESGPSFECDYCSGTGEIERDVIRCEYCKGKGIVREDLPEPDICGWCKGSGIVIKK